MTFGYIVDAPTIAVEFLWMTFRRIMEDELNADLMQHYVNFVDLFGALAPGAAPTPPTARPPSLTDEERGEVAHLAGGESRPLLVFLLTPANGTYRYILNARWGLVES